MNLPRPTHMQPTAMPCDCNVSRSPVDQPRSLDLPCPSAQPLLPESYAVQAWCSLAQQTGFHSETTIDCGTYMVHTPLIAPVHGCTQWRHGSWRLCPSTSWDRDATVKACACVAVGDSSRTSSGLPCRGPRYQYLLVCAVCPLTEACLYFAEWMPGAAVRPPVHQVPPSKRQRCVLWLLIISPGCTCKTVGGSD